VLARLIGGLSVALALIAALPALAGAALTRDAQRVYDDYRSDGAISPCRHTADVYRTTLKEITPGVEEESPAFRPAVEASLEAREHEMCGEPTDGGGSGSTTSPASSGSSASGGAVTAGDPGAVPSSPAADGGAAAADGEPGAAPAPPTGGTPAQPVEPAPAPAPATPPAAAAEQVLVNRPYHGTPTGLVIASVLVGLALLALLAAAAAGRYGWGDERLAGARHAWGEAAYRAGGTWGDFLDWVRLGR
jgi:hypothetical protein